MKMWRSLVLSAILESNPQSLNSTAIRATLEKVVIKVCHCVLFVPRLRGRRCTRTYFLSLWGISAPCPRIEISQERLLRVQIHKHCYHIIVCVWTGFEDRLATFFVHLLSIRDHTNRVFRTTKRNHLYRFLDF